MKSNVFAFVGIILIGAGILVYFMMGSARITGAHGSAPTFDPDAARYVVRWSVGGGLALLGLLLLFAGLRGRAKAAKATELANYIIQSGIDTTGTVTFVDKNYYLTINNKPIYSIIEYTYKDGSGMDHVRKMDNVPSDWVIRNKIEVGGNLKLKYMREDPAQSVMLF